MSKKIIIAILAAIVVIAGVFVTLAVINHDSAEIANETVETYDTSDGNVRLRITTDITVKDGVMTNLDFGNVNKDRIMDCAIKIDDNCVYQSPKIETGKKIVSDKIDISSLEPGTYEAVAEIRSYTGENLSGQTNIGVNLIVE